MWERVSEGLGVDSCFFLTSETTVIFLTVTSASIPIIEILMIQHLEPFSNGDQVSPEICLCTKALVPEQLEKHQPTPNFKWLQGFSLGLFALCFFSL